MTAESYTDLLKPIKNFRIFEYNVTKLNEEAAESLNIAITTSEIEAVIKKLPAHKTVDQMASQANFTKHLKKN